MIPDARSRLFSALCMAFAGFTSWTLSDAAIRYLRAYPPEQIGFITAIFSLAFIACFSTFMGGFRASLQKPKQGLQLLRGAMLSISGFASFYAFSHLPLVNAFAIVFLSPIAAKILSVLINREHIPRAAWVVSLVGFAGVMLVVRPGFEALSVGEIAALCIPLTFSLGFVLVKKIGEENMTPLSTNLYYVTGLAILTAKATVTHFMPMAPLHFALTLCIAVTSAIGTYCVTRAYARGPAAIIAPVHYTQIIWGLIWGVLFFHEYPDAWTVAGASVIVASGIALIAITRRG